MKKEYKIAIIILLIISFAIIGCLWLLENNIIRNYYIKDFTIDVNIEKDGDIQVKEDTTYRFNGQYNGITITIPTNVSKEFYTKLTKDSRNDSVILPDYLYTANGIENVSIYVVENGNQRIIEKVDKADVRR